MMVTCLKWQALKREKHLNYLQSVIYSLKTHSQLILKTSKTNGRLVSEVSRCSNTKQPLTGTLPPPDIPTSLNTPPYPTPLPHSPPTWPCPPWPFHFTTIVPSFSGILISTKTNESRISLSPLLPPPFSYFLPLFLSVSWCRWKAGIEPAVAFQNLRPRLQCVWLFNTAGSH